MSYKVIFWLIIITVIFFLHFMYFGLVNYKSMIYQSVFFLCTIINEAALHIQVHWKYFFIDSSVFIVS